MRMCWISSGADFDDIDAPTPGESKQKENGKDEDTGKEVGDMPNDTGLSKDEDENSNSGSSETLLSRKIGASFDPYHGKMCILHLDAPLLNSSLLECYCLFLTIYKYGSGPQKVGHKFCEIACILLTPVPDQDNTYKRVGTLSFKALLALKMRYVIREGAPIEDEFWEPCTRERAEATG